MTQPSIAIFLPAYNEAENIERTVNQTIQALSRIASDYKVIIVNDGSSDGTGDIAATLGRRHPGHVLPIDHPQNRGYGAALQTGFQAGLSTGHDWVGFADADGQFEMEEIELFLDAAESERAEMVAGYRIDRADSPMRRRMGHSWGWLSARVVGHGLRDVDCGFKLIHRDALQRINLTGTHASVSPELGVKVRRSGTTIAEVGVTHYPRAAGEQTGANMAVVMRSLLGLLALRRQLALEARAGTALALRDGPERLRSVPDTARRSSGPSTDDEVAGSHDRTPRALGPAPSGRVAGSTWAVAGLASVLSVAAYVYCYRQGWTLAYRDSVSHMLIARRVIDSPTPGLGQLGTVWLPLPHLLMLPLVGIDKLYYSGFAGSVISMAAYVVTAVYLYKLVRGLSGDAWAGWVAAIVFMINANVLYMQTTPMTELLLLATMVASAYHVMRWSVTRSYLQLMAAGFATLLATLSRYEGWILAVAMTGAVLYIAIRQKRSWKQMQDLVIGFGLFWVSGVGLWMLWNQLIDKNPLSFQNGEYAKPSLWVGSGEVSVGHWDLAAKTYAYAVQGNIGWIMLAVGGAGIVTMVIRTWGRTEAVSSLVFLVFVPFFVAALQGGQRPLHVAQLTGDLYNVRFGMLMIIPVAIGAGYLTNLGRRTRWHAVPKVLVVAAAIAGTVLMVRDGDVTTLNEGKAMLASDTEARSQEASAALRDAYDGGLILMEGVGNETIPFDAEISLSNVVYEGSEDFKDALEDPQGHDIRWIVMRRTDGQTDRVYDELHDSPALEGYEITHTDADRVIYQVES